MSKRVVIGLVVAVSLFALFGREAKAATCIQYRVVGGSAYCTAWSTKGVLFEVKFDQACEGSEGPGTCTATVIAQSNDNVAFCARTGGGAPIRVNNCTAPVTFTGNTSTTECVPKHEQDVTGEGGVGHEHHGCTATLKLARAGSCDSCCAGVVGSTGVCVDVTPVEMLTQTEVFPAISGESNANCSPGSSSCLIQELCSINPKKIVFISDSDPNFTGSREYQCNLQCVGEGGEGNPSGCERIFPPDID